MVTKIVTTAMVMIAIFVLGLFLTVTMFDPIISALETTGFGQFSGQVDNIHAVAVKWMVPIGIFSVLGWAVFRILRTERQTIR